MFPEYYGSAFHAIDYIARRWTKLFKIRAWVPGLALSYQDSLVLEKRSSTAGHASADPEVLRKTPPCLPADRGTKALGSSTDAAEMIRKLDEIQQEFTEFRQRVEKALGVGWEEIQALRRKKR
jgi:hypothetical protein